MSRPQAMPDWDSAHPMRCPRCERWVKRLKSGEPAAHTLPISYGRGPGVKCVDAGEPSAAEAALRALGAERIR